jgi:murein DD-endopeptidase MepM/ murein hydrolase activator NlpD
VTVSLLLWTLAPALPARSAHAKADTGSEWDVRWQPAHPANGSPLLLEVKTAAHFQRLHGKWLGHELEFTPNAAKQSWFTLAGVSLETAAGSHPLKLEGEDESGKRVTFEQAVPTVRARYKTVSVSVPKKFVAPDAKQLEQIKQDRQIKQQVFGRSTPEREWQGRFQPPLAAEVTDEFGTKREFNGAVQSVHEGLDYRAHQGTPIAALNAGTVVLARPLYFEGNCVVVDHGQGLLSLYMHLSKFLAKEGDKVSAGEELGLSGATGRATGPHLHIAVRWQGEYLNPEVLFSLPTP